MTAAEGLAAITLHQPWASLIAAGIKTIETRPRRTSYRGRIAIHAGKEFHQGGWTLGLLDATNDVYGGFACYPDTQPLGAIVASAILTDCLPIVDYAEPGSLALLHNPDHPGLVCVPPSGELMVWRPGEEYGTVATDQLPFGDFMPGRFALLLDDIFPTTERCPACWGQDFPECPAGCGCSTWDDADRRDCACDGPCCFAEPLTDYPGVRWDDRWCEPCGAAGRCDPIPARGQRAVPWRWRP